MDHDYAIRERVAEAYLLDELTEEERDAYERHFFNCRVCAQELEDAAEFLWTAQSILRSDRALVHAWRKPRSRWPRKMLGILDEFYFGYPNHRMRVFIFVWIAGVLYGVFNTMVLGRSEARVSIETAIIIGCACGVAPFVISAWRRFRG